MKISICMVAAMAAGLVWGVPSVTVDSVTPDAGAPVSVTVAYTLSGKAVVTAEMFAETAALKGEFDGDVNMLLEAGSHTFRWRADVSAGGTYSADALTAKVKAWDPESPPDYMAVDLWDPATPVQYYATSNDVPGGVTSRKYAIDWILFRRIPAAGVVWRMGSSTSTYRVKLTYDYYLGVYPFTIGQYNAAKGNASYALNTNSGLKWPGNNLNSWPTYLTMDVPATTSCSTWRGADWPTNLYNGVGGYVAEIATRINLPVDMPTEAEWEFACRAGCADDEAADLDAVAWYRDNSVQVYTNGAYQCHMPMPVGLKRPNAYGLYDMLGGISEWVLDWYGSYDIQTPYTVDPHGPAGPNADKQRVLRGGCYAATADRCRYYRNSNDKCTQNWWCITGIGSSTRLAHVAAQDHYEGGIRLRLPARAIR